MNSEYIALQKWGKSGSFYKFKIKEKQIVRYTPASLEEEVMSGFVCIFLFNKKIAVYKVQNVWKFSLQKRIFDFKEIKEIKVSKKGIIVKLVIELQNEKIILFEVSFFDVLSSDLDPTYDDFDKCTEIFSYWLEDTFRKFRIRCPIRSMDSSIFS